MIALIAARAVNLTIANLKLIIEIKKAMQSQVRQTMALSC